jgi:hypothetical protein
LAARNAGSRPNSELGTTNVVNLLDLCALAVPGRWREDGSFGRRADRPARVRRLINGTTRSLWTTLYLYEYNGAMDAKLPGVGVPLQGPETRPTLHAQPRLLAAVDGAEPRRRRIWEIGNSFHCSIIGTCLTTVELHRILVKVELPGAQKETDHQLHGRAVLLAGRRDVASRLLQKALDRRHRSAIDRFSRARNAEDLRSMWDGAVERAEIPGAYWAVLTHPGATEDLVRHVFGEVHMLSHLVGAANRADIRRLRGLEAENAALQQKVGRQQGQLREAVVSRDATIASLSDMLGKALASRHCDGASAGPADDAERETTARLVSDLRQSLESEVVRRERANRRLQGVVAERDAERKQREACERQVRDLRDELEAAELALEHLVPAREAPEAAPGNLGGVTLLYVGGRTHQICLLGRLAEQCGAILLHHDGGIDDRSGLLEAQVARADRTLFPVDCVSHNAVAVIKRVARSLGRPYVALRSSGLTSFAAALRSIAAGRLQSEAGPAMMQPTRAMSGR